MSVARASTWVAPEAELPGWSRARCFGADLAPRTAVVSLVFLLALSGGCRQRELVGVSDRVVALPNELDFGPVELERGAELTVSFEGLGEGTLAVLPPYSVDEPEFTAPARRTFSFRPTMTGPFEATVRLPGDTALQLRGTGVVPRCRTTTPCVTSTWSEALGRCEQLTVADGSRCDDPCLEAGVCVAGRCVGAARSCDDADACTVDTCDQGLGCEHRAVACTAPLDPCLAARCDVTRGCVAEPVLDGTRCGPADCSQAHICLEGRCVKRPVPDGAPCGEASTCQERGVCRSSRCDQPPPHKLRRLWSHQTPSPFSLTFPGLSDSGGNLYWVEGHTQLVSVTSAGVLRWSVTLNVSVSPDEEPFDTFVLADGLVLLGYHYGSMIEARQQRDGSRAWRLELQSHDGRSRHLSDFATARGALFVVDVVDPRPAAAPMITGLSRIDLATGTVTWERFLGETAPPSFDQRLEQPTVVVDGEGPVVGNAASEHQTLSPAELAAFTFEGQRRWSFDSKAQAVAYVEGRVLVRDDSSISWVSSDGGLVPSSLPSSAIRPSALATSGGLVVAGLVGSNGLVLRNDTSGWVTSFASAQTGLTATTPPLLTSKGLVSFASFASVTQPILVELDPSTGRFSTCEFDVDRGWTLGTRNHAIERPGMLVVTDQSNFRVWAFER